MRERNVSSSRVWLRKNMVGMSLVSKGVRAFLSDDDDVFDEGFCEAKLVIHVDASERDVRDNKRRAVNAGSVRRSRDDLRGATSKKGGHHG